MLQCFPTKEAATTNFAFHLKCYFQEATHHCYFIKQYALTVVDLRLEVLYEHVTTSAGNFSIDVAAFTEYSVTIEAVNDGNLTSKTSKELLTVETGRAFRDCT